MKSRLQLSAATLIVSLSMLPGCKLKVDNDRSEHAADLQSADLALAGESAGTPASIVMQTGVSVGSTGFPSTFYGFPVSGGIGNMTALTGNIAVNNSGKYFAETLFLLQYLPNGPCPAQFPASTPQFGPPGAIGLANLIVKAPNPGLVSQPVNLLFPNGGLPIAGCVVIGINGGPAYHAESTQSATNLVLSYNAGAASSGNVGLYTGGEFMPFNKAGQSYATMLTISTPVVLRALYGNVSNSTGDGTAGANSIGKLPTGAWASTNDFFVYQAADCAKIAAAGKKAGTYLKQRPKNAITLNSTVLRGKGKQVAFGQVNQGYSLPLFPGQCIVQLYSMNANGGFDMESQVFAMLGPQ